MRALAWSYAVSPTPPPRAPQDSSFPAYDRVTPAQVVPGIRCLLTQLSAELDAREASVGGRGARARSHARAVAIASPSLMAT